MLVENVQNQIVILTFNYLFFSKAVESDLPEDLKNEAASRFQAAIDSRMAIGPTMSFYPDFVSILSKFYPDKIAIWIKLG